MCSFIFCRSRTPITNDQLEVANRFSRLRGPDHTKIVRLQEKKDIYITMLHNLLDISGAAAEQPVTLNSDGTEYYALFNGEIYNFKEFGSYKSDTACILPGWLQYGNEFPEKLAGEYAIVIYNRRKQTLNILVDQFLTKPLYFGQCHAQGIWGAATCASSLRSIGIEDVNVCTPNSTLHVDFSTEEPVVQLTRPVFEFNLRQHNHSYDQWIDAFVASVEKRAMHGQHRPVVFLSSGYDSGAICLALNLLGLNYDTFTILAGENQAVIKQRLSRNRRSSRGRAFISQGLSPQCLARLRREICDTVEPFTYVHEDQPGRVGDLQNDGGALGGYFLAEWARRESRYVNLSGCGADEIISDYGWNGNKFYYHSEFGGKFPSDLQQIFPWKKFYDDTQRSYLFKDEYILGRFGIEGRYPFLDRSVVQEFLHLTSEQKNRCYKAPISAFLEKYDYPTEKCVKRGFSPLSQDSFWQKALRRLRF